MQKYLVTIYIWLDNGFNAPGVMHLKTTLFRKG